MDECFRKLWYFYVMEYCLATKRNKLLIHATSAWKISSVNSLMSASWFWYCDLVMQGINIREAGEGYVESLCIFFVLSCESIVITKSKIKREVVKYFWLFFCSEFKTSRLINHKDHICVICFSQYKNCARQYINPTKWHFICVFYVTHFFFMLFKKIFTDVFEITAEKLRVQFMMFCL